MEATLTLPRTEIFTGADAQIDVADARVDNIDDVSNFTEQEWKEMCESLHAECRVKYKEKIADYIRRFGEEPSLGTLIAAEARAECNNHTEEERDANIARAMSIIYGTATQPHARHTTRR